MIDGRRNAPVELPTGTVTMLFSDMEGSTRLLSRLGERYGEGRPSAACYAPHSAGSTEPKWAPRLTGTAKALREQAGMPIAGPDAELLEEYLAVARDAVSAQS